MQLKLIMIGSLLAWKKSELEPIIWSSGEHVGPKEDGGSYNMMDLQSMNENAVLHMCVF